MSIMENWCVGCISSDRRLIQLNKMESLREEIFFCELNKSDGGICWECQGVIRKFHKFRIKVQEAQVALKGAKIKNIEPLSSLTKKLITSADAEHCYNDDPLTTSVNDDIKLDIKIEIDDTNNDGNTPNDNGIQNFNDNGSIQKIDTVPTKNDIKQPANKKKIEKKMAKTEIVTLQDKNDLAKLVHVTLTEEEIFKTREEKRNHPNFKKLPYKCDSCVLGFTRKDRYAGHIENKHNEKIGPHVCDICHIRFPTLLSMGQHRAKHFSCYKCILCEHECFLLRSAIAHSRSKHSSDHINSIHCAQCDTVVRNSTELEDHVQKKHTLHCDVCGTTFKNRTNLRRHKIRIHTVKREFQCDLCSKSFKTKSRLESHMAHHSGTIAKKLAYCHVCHIQYKNLYVYRNHLKHSVNHLERTFPCPKCEKKFVCKKYRNDHFNFFHLKISQYKCKPCNKLFISEWRLTDHRQKHHGMSRSRDYQCTICGKEFYNKSTLRAHQLTHSEQRSFMCEDCGDTFKQRPALFNHVRIVHGDKPHKKNNKKLLNK